MNEELKIIITAVTAEAKKSIQGVKQELGGVQASAKSASSGVSAAFKGVGIAAVAAVAAIAAVGVALVKLGKASLDFQKAQAKLNTAFLSMGSTAQQAAESYNNLFRFMGDADTSAEAAAHLAKLTTNQKELAEWTKICQGVYATFGDSLAIESLTEAANETARVGKVTGTMADALNWAGVSEDEFNAKLAKTASYEEREALIRSTLNGLYSDAAEIYEKNNKALLEHNESQAKLDASLARAGQSVLPLMTALNNLSATLFDALKPAIDVIVPAMATFVNWITQGIQAVMGLFGAVTGASTSITSMANAGAGIGTAANGANNLASGLDDAAKAAEKAKKATMGFDELNIVSTGSSSSGSGSGSGTNAPSYMAPQVGAQNFTVETTQTENKANGLAATLKKVAAELKDVFAPTIKAWSSGFDTIKKAWDDSKENFKKGAVDIKDSLVSIAKYVLGDFVPSLVNSFSTNLVPMITDLFGFALEETSKNFETFGYITKDVTENVIIPALDVLKSIYMDMFEAIGDAWEEHGEPIMTEWSEAMDHVRTTLVTLYDEFLQPITDKITKKIKEVWDDSLEPVYRKFVDAVMEIGECLLQLYNDFIAPIVDWFVDKILPHVKTAIDNIINYVGDLLKAIGDIVGGYITYIKGIIQFITGVFTGDWEKAWEGIKNIFSGVWEVIKGIAKAAWTAIKHTFDPTIAKAAFSATWEAIKGVFTGVGTWFKNIFTSAWDGIKGAWGNVKTFFSGVWSNIKSCFGNIGDWFKDKFSAAWTAVKNVFSSGGKVFDGIKDGILNGLKAVINKLIDGINKVIKVPFDGINSALKKIKDISIAGVKPFSWMPTISVPQIPKLAKGGIVDRATLAMIGERGKEAVVPLENNTAWMDKLVDKLLSRTSGPSKIVLMLDGKELGWANINSINNITRQTGALQLVMA
jgi:phage-related protein